MLHDPSEVSVCTLVCVYKYCVGVGACVRACVCVHMCVHTCVRVYSNYWHIILSVYLQSEINVLNLGLLI